MLSPFHFKGNTPRTLPYLSRIHRSQGKTDLLVLQSTVLGLTFVINLRTLLFTYDSSEGYLNA